MLRSLIISLMVIGLMSMSVGAVLADSDGNATSTEDGLDPNATSSDPGLDPNATSSDPGLDPNATSSDPGLDPNATSSDPGLDPNATSSDPGLDPNATSTDDGTGGDGERRKAFVGVISGFATSTVGYSITLTQKGTGEPVQIYLGGDEIQYKYPGGPNAWGSLQEAIAGEAEFVILTRRTDEGNDAIFVLVKPMRPSYLPLVGTAIGTEDGVTTLLLPNGKTKKVKKPKGTEDPDDGEVVTVFVEDTGEEDDGEPAQATGLVKASKIADRIQSFLAKLAEDDGSLPEAAVAALQRRVSRLAAVLEQHSAQNVSLIEKVSKAQGLGSGTAAGIQRALEKAQAGQAKGKAIADDAKNKVGLGQNAGKGPKNILGPSNAGDGSDDDDDGADSGGSGKPDGSGKPANAGSQGSNRGSKGNSGG